MGLGLRLLTRCHYGTLIQFLLRLHRVIYGSTHKQWETFNYNPLDPVCNPPAPRAPSYPLHSTPAYGLGTGLRFVGAAPTNNQVALPWDILCHRYCYYSTSSAVSSSPTPATPEFQRWISASMGGCQTPVNGRPLSASPSWRSSFLQAPP